MAGPPGGRAARAVSGEPSVVRPVLQFAIASLLVLVVLTVAGVLILRQVSTDAATRQARDLALLAGQGIVEPALQDGLLTGDPAALEDVGLAVEERVLGERIVRVKLWSEDGRILYSDEPRLTGESFPLADDKREVLETGRVEAEVSDLGRPENVYERAQGRLLEVYVPLRTPGGEQVLFETYQRLDAVTASGRRIWLAAAPVAIGALLVLWLVQLPLAWRLASRVRAGRREREALLERAVEASDEERRRIASELHDGVVQDMAGLAYGLDAAAAGAEGEAAGALRDGAGRARRAMRGLRTLLVEIHPPSLRSEGLRAALSDLLAPAEARGISVGLDMPEGVALAAETEELLFRVAREGVRNAMEHARPSRVEVRVRAGDGRARLEVRDDGTGSSPQERARRREEGHLGLVLLEELAAGRGGSLTLESSPGSGTRLAVEVPLQ